MAPNDTGVPDPGQDTYVGSVEKQVKDKAVHDERAKHEGDGGWPHDPDHQLDEARAFEEALRQYTAAQHSRLAQGIEMRAGPEIDGGGTNYLGITHEKLHEMVNTGIDPAQVNIVGVTWHDIGMTMRGIGDRLAKASAETEQGWSGRAAEGARAFNSGVAQWSGTTAQGALLSSNNMYTQSHSAGVVRNSVPPPMKYSLADQLHDLMSIPDPAMAMSIVRVKLQQQQDLHQQAADAVAAYDEALTGSSSTMPTFEPPPTFDPNPHDPPRNPGGNEPPPIGPAPAAPIGGRQPSGGDRTATDVGSPPSGTDSRPTPDQIGALDRRARQPDATGTDPSQVDSGPTGQGGPRYTTVVVAGQGGLGPIGGRGPGEPGFGPAPVGGWGGGPGGARGGVHGRIPGPVGGAPGFGSVAAGRGVAGVAGARGAAGMSGMPMGAGGSGRGGEDEEHERPSYLLEPDPNAIFGTDEMTAPPVIE